MSVGHPGRDPLKVMPEVLLTFDDGFESIAQNAIPQVQARGWGAVVFLISGFVGRDDSWDVRVLGGSRPLLNWSEVRALASAGIVFGSHSRTHRDLTALSSVRLRAELCDSKREIEDQVGQPVTLLSYPFGRHSERVRDAAREAGYDAAFCVSGATGDRYAIPRVNMHALMTLREVRRILGGGSKPTWRTRLFTSLSAGSATVGNWRNMDRHDDPVATMHLATRLS